jgi:hypothetical protein
MYNYHDSQACGYNRCAILSRLDGTGNGMVWNGFGIVVWNRVIHSTPLWIILSGNLSQLN